LLETERMLITEFSPADDVGMFEFDSDKEVHKFLGNKPFKTFEQSRDLIEFIQRQYVENGIGRWAILDKTSNEFVG
jgi:[ribosomal protein S5]-alanine N-acetyltransferase